MATVFDLVIRLPSGGVRAMALEASDASTARVSAVQGGATVLTCSARAAASGLAGRLTIRNGHNRFDIATLSFELASLMSAGLSVLDSLQTLAAKEKSTARKTALLDVVGGVREGMALSQALARRPGMFPRLLIATVSASEQTGDLSTSLRRYSEHQQGMRALRDKVVGAAIYPMLLLAVGLVVIAFLLGVVVPKFAVLIESTRRELPWSSQLMMSWGRLAADHAWAVAAGALAALVVVVAGATHLVRTGAKARWVEALPLIGPVVRQFRHSQLYRTTGMLVRGGIPAPRAFDLTADLLGDQDRRRMRNAIALLREGRSISDALQAAGLADPVASSMLTVAERTGGLAEILERIALFHESTLQRSVELTSKLFEPLLMIVIGLVIGAIVVLMYLPIFDLASSLQ